MTSDEAVASRAAADARVASQESKISNSEARVLGALVASWETVGTYVATLDRSWVSIDRAVRDCLAEVGRAGDHGWLVRAHWDVQPMIYSSEAYARDAAVRLARARDEAYPGEDAKAYLTRLAETGVA